MISLAVLGFTALTVALLAVRGGEPERWAALAVIIYLVAVPALEGVKVGEWRVGVAIAETVLFLALWILAERNARWWLTAAAGFQLISVLTFVAPMFFDHFLVWTGVAIRLGAWILVTFALLFAVYEVSLLHRHRQENRYG
jgi:hypothetical protein